MTATTDRPGPAHARDGSQLRHGGPRVLTGRELQRVSHDKSGRLVSMEDQHFENETDALDLGVTLGEPYREAGAASASRYGRKSRDASYGALCDDLDAGTFGADYLWCWKVNRGSRQTWEWLRLMQALEDAGVLLRVTCERRTYDMTNPADRKSLRDAASDAEAGSDEISQTVKRAARRDARKGHPHGKIVYGYRREYRINDGSELRPGEYLFASDETKVGRQVPDPVESTVVRDIFGWIHHGESLRSITAALNGAGPRAAMGATLAADAARLQGTGIPTSEGGPWTPPRVRDIATNPVYIARRLHTHGRGRRPVFGPSDLQAGNWPALVSEAQFWTVYGRLTNPGRSTASGRGRQPKWLLSMVATCGKCEGPLSVRFTHKSGRPSYTCRDRSCVTTDAGDLDTLVTEAVLALLSAPDAYAMLADAGGPDPALESARDELATVRAEHDELTRMVGAGRLSAVLAAAAEPAILARLEAAERRVRALEAPAGVSGLGLGPGPDIAARWDAAPITACRAVLRILFQRIAVMPAGRGFAGPVEDRTELTRR